MEEQIALLTKEITLEGISEPLILCKAEDGRVLDLTKDQEVYLRGIDEKDDLFVRVVDMLDEGKLAVLQRWERKLNNERG
ncbi:MAG: hypothetical protein ABSG44_17895 [Thermodesulfobacteriota bacterium]|jgi:hypothetical protein